MKKGITLDEAIDRNSELIGELIREGRLEKAKSVKLGNEAMKAVRYYRKGHFVVASKPLHGETE